MAKSIVLGGGCFWCIEACFLEVDGVIDVTPGYAGGTTGNPTYEQVCSGVTGHAEVVRIDYDLSIVGRESLLEIFFNVHDPTTLNAQGHDYGTQYRSVIFYADEAEKKIIESAVALANSEWRGQIVTEIAPLTEFYEAESYHKRYFLNNPEKAYCQVVIKPKYDQFRKKFSDSLRQKPKI